MLPRPENNPDKYYQQPLESRPELQEEYERGVQELIKRLRGKGFAPIFVLAFGSLTRKKKLRFLDDPSDLLASDADFIVITRPTFRTLFSQQFELGRREDGKHKREKPFSPHIPNLDVKVWTPEYCMKQLQTIAEEYESLVQSSGEREHDLIWDEDDVTEEKRQIHERARLVEILVYGIPVFISDKDEHLLQGVRAALQRAQEAVAAYQSMLEQSIQARK